MKEVSPKQKKMGCGIKNRRCWWQLFVFVVVFNVLKALCGVALLGLAYQPDHNTCTLIKNKLNLPCKEHTVTTSDGYVLSLKRIGYTSPSPPVLLIHGALDSSATFVISGRNDSLAGFLYENNYDVWLLDKRGRAPWRHEVHNGQGDEFWDFGLDEIILHDVPAAIGYITRLTEQPLASVIGHSQGGTLTLAALAAKPELESSVLSFVGMAPPLDFPMKLPGAPVTLWMANIGHQFFHPAVFSAGSRVLLNGITTAFPSFAPYFICSFGCESTENLQLVPEVFGYYPREASYKVVNQVQQIEKSGVFQRYDYGPDENLRRYGQVSPVKYDFSSVTTPMALFYGKYDKIVNISPNSKFLAELQPGTLKLLNTSLPYGHADFIWGRSAKTMLYPDILKHIRSHSNKQ